MKKGILGVLLSVFLVSSIFAGGAQESTQGEKVVTMFHNKVEIKDALDAYAALYSENTDGVTVTVEALGGGGDYGSGMKAKAQSDQIPDIFVIEGMGGYEIWKDYIADLSDQPWVNDTDLEMIVDGKVIGFPVAIEGYGMAYNAGILDKAGIDPTTLTTRDAYEEAFKTLEAKKDLLGIDAPVSMAASLSGGMWWVAAQHNLAVYWGGGLGFTDTSVIDMALEGKMDEARFREYAKYLQLLYKYSDQAILVNGAYDDQVAAFAQGKTAFLHQGNWVDPNLGQLNADFEMGYAPHAFTNTPQEGLFLFAPSFYVVNKLSPNVEEAKKFLATMAGTPEGHSYMVNDASMIPAFNSVTLEPKGKLSQALMEANKKGGNYGVFFGMLPDGAGQNVFGPIYDLFAQEQDNLEGFIADMKVAIGNLPNM